MAISQSEMRLFEKLFDAKLSRVYEKLDNIDGNVSSLNKAIYGNGQPGLSQRMDFVERSLSVIVAKFAFITATFLLIAGAIEPFLPSLVAKLLGK